MPFLFNGLSLSGSQKELAWKDIGSKTERYTSMGKKEKKKKQRIIRK